MAISIDPCGGEELVAVISANEFTGEFSSIGTGRSFLRGRARGAVCAERAASEAGATAKGKLGEPRRLGLRAALLASVPWGPARILRTADCPSVIAFGDGLVPSGQREGPDDCGGVRIRDNALAPRHHIATVAT